MQVNLWKEVELKLYLISQVNEIKSNINTAYNIIGFNDQLAPKKSGQVRKNPLAFANAVKIEMEQPIGY